MAKRLDATDLADFLDVDAWPCLQGVGSTHGPICPHCNTLQRVQILRPDGRAACETCAKPFLWTDSQGPLGRQWNTWIVAPAADAGTHHGPEGSP